jgi:hypothetical protein
MSVKFLFQDDEIWSYIANGDEISRLLPKLSKERVVHYIFRQVKPEFTECKRGETARR